MLIICSIGRKKANSKFRSPVWQYFTCESSNDATCKLCNAHVLRKNNTSNLLAHLKHNHGAIHSTLVLSQQAQKKKLKRPSAGSVSAPTEVVDLDPDDLDDDDDDVNSFKFCLAFV